MLILVNACVGRIQPTPQMTNWLARACPHAAAACPTQGAVLMLRALCAHVVPLLSDALAEPQEAVARWAAAVPDAREAIPSGASGATCCFVSWRNAYMMGLLWVLCLLLRHLRLRQAPCARLPPSSKDLLHLLMQRSTPKDLQLPMQSSTPTRCRRQLSALGAGAKPHSLCGAMV